jgi:hypothetical protein
MSPLPGPVIERGSRRTVRTLSTDTGQAFMAAVTQRGPITAQEVHSLSEWVDLYGGRETDSYAYDAVDTFFSLGGRVLHFSRVVGTTPVFATNVLSDGSGTAVTAVAKEYGAHVNSWTLAAAASGGSFTLTLVGTDGNGDAFSETIGPYATVAALIAADPSDRIGWTLGTGTDPVTAAADAFTGGTDDRASVSTTHHTTALNKFLANLGPGTVLLPNLTSAAGHAVGEAHADTHGRWFAGDGTDTGTAATLVTLAETSGAQTGAWASALFGPWLVVRGPIGSSGTTRTVPAAPAVAALAARNDGRGLSPNKPVAGRNGIFDGSFVLGLAQTPWTDADRTDLNEAGFNVIREFPGDFRVYGFRSLDQTDEDWELAGNARFYTKLRARAETIAEDYVLDEINPVQLASLESDLLAMLSEYFPLSLVPDDSGTMASAFAVDMSENTPATAAAEEIYASLQVRMAGMAEKVTIRVVKVAVSESIAG